jgi:hypothetical protein
MTPRAHRAKRSLGPLLIALAVLLLLGQIQSSTHRLIHPLSARSCEVCAFAHHPLALAPKPPPAPPTPSEIREPRTGPFRSEPFAAIAPSAERAPPPASVSA